jgi:Ca-activated chloride channel family protein
VRLVANATEEKCDLVITDRSEDLAIPAPLGCYVGIIPQDLQKLVTGQQGSAVPVDWRRDSPLLQHVDFTDVVSVDDPHSAAEVRAGDFANAGYDILIHGPRGPMMVEKQEEGKRSAYLFFHTDHTTLPYRVGFPVFVTNLVQAALKETHLAESAAIHTGALPPLRMPAQHAYEIVAPDGSRHRETTDDHGVLSGLAASHAGEYTILDGSEARARLGASLLSPAETSLKSTDQIQFNEQLAVSAASAPLKADRALWYPLACIAFALLLVEWWLFQRNPRLSVPKPQSAK